MYWYKLAEDSREILVIYKVVPSLQQRRLRAVYFGHGRSIGLSLADIPFPDPMLLRWKQRGYNVLYLGLGFWNVELVELTQWSMNNVVDVHIERTGAKQIEATVISTSCHVRVLAQGFDIGLIRKVDDLSEKS